MKMAPRRPGPSAASGRREERRAAPAGSTRAGWLFTLIRFLHGESGCGVGGRPAPRSHQPAGLGGAGGVRPPGGPSGQGPGHRESRLPLVRSACDFRVPAGTPPDLLAPQVRGTSRSLPGGPLGEAQSERAIPHHGQQGLLKASGFSTGGRPQGGPPGAKRRQPTRARVVAARWATANQGVQPPALQSATAPPDVPRMVPAIGRELSGRLPGRPRQQAVRPPCGPPGGKQGLPNSRLEVPANPPGKTEGLCET